jgi:hypothetical protein
MSLALKILLLLDAFFALLLAVYLFIKYKRKFKKRPEIIINANAKEETEVEVTYEEEKVKVVTEEVSAQVQAPNEAKEDKLNIGSYDDLEALIRKKSEEKK